MSKNKETREEKVKILLEYLKNKNYQSVAEELKNNSLTLKDKKPLLEHNENIIIKTFFNSIIESGINELSEPIIDAANLLLYILPAKFIDVYIFDFFDLKIKIINELFLNTHNNKEKFKLDVDLKQYILNKNKELSENIDSEASTEELPTLPEDSDMSTTEDSMMMGESSNDS
ncbi:MAG: hypothetical protein EKK61_03385 [Rickettsiales bacterium]|nr:MAG: hypothetical protein EKK61_03385 [Rickettsiales bacterium]